jgi:hypothetical protein
VVDNRVHELEVSHDHHGSRRFGLGLGLDCSGVELSVEVKLRVGTNVGLSVCLAVS